MISLNAINESHNIQLSSNEDNKVTQMLVNNKNIKEVKSEIIEKSTDILMVEINKLEPDIKDFLIMLILTTLLEIKKTEKLFSFIFFNLINLYMLISIGLNPINLKNIIVVYCHIFYFNSIIFIISSLLFQKKYKTKNSFNIAYFSQIFLMFLYYIRIDDFLKIFKIKKITNLEKFWWLFLIFVLIFIAANNYCHYKNIFIPIS